MSRIMLIEDDAGMRSAIRRVLEREGHTVVEESDGKSALRHYAGDPTDLVISDVIMPQMSGLEFLARIREVFPDSKAIIISGGGPLQGGTVLYNAATLGADRVLEKPFEVDDLLAAVRELLDE